MREMISESRYLVHLLRCAIRDEQPQELPQSLSFGKVFSLGRAHSVENIAYYSVSKLDRKPEAALYREWELRCNMALTRDVNQSFAREEILDAFAQAGIRCLEVQGTKIKPFYPQPEYRTMADLDFIIDRENLGKAWQLLEELGYECEDNHGVEVDAFRAPNINIEVHSEYFPASSAYHTVMRPPFASVEETGAYDVNELYIYNILHIAKHYFKKGCGLRQVLDVYYLNRHYGPVLNREYVASVFQKAGVVEFAEKLSALAEHWFGDGPFREDLEEMEAYLLSSGVNGNRYNHLNNELKAMQNQGIRCFRLKYSLKRIFVGKTYLYGRYPITKKWKILLPFSWVYRLFAFVTPGGRRRLRQELGILTKSDWKQEKNV